jgi:hypothetical protein
MSNIDKLIYKLRRNIMWPDKKDDDVTLPPGRTLEIGFGVEWRRGKNEVIITTEKEKFVLNGQNELFLEITSSNTDPIMVQIVPDFKKRTINVVEVINANATYVKGKNKGKISFAGIRPSKEDDNVSIDKYLKAWDENIESFGRRIHSYKKRRNIYTIFGIIVIIGNVYLFTINESPIKYLNAAVAIIIVYVLFRMWNSLRELGRLYEEYKEQRSKAFEVAKNE